MTGEALQRAIRAKVVAHPWVNVLTINSREWSIMYNVAEQHGFEAFCWCLARASETKKPASYLGSYIKGIADKHKAAKPWAEKPAAVAGKRFVREDE